MPSNNMNFVKNDILDYAYIWYNNDYLLIEEKHMI